MRLSLFAAAVLCVSSLAAHASSITQSVSFGPAPTDLSTTGTPPALNFFNTNLGTLNSIGFTYAYSLTSTITVTDMSTTPASGSVTPQSGAQFDSTNAAVSSVLRKSVDNYVDPIDGTTVSFGTSSLTPIAADVRGTTSTFSSLRGQQTFTSYGSYSAGTITDTNASDLAAFSSNGAGSFIPMLNTLTGLNITNSSGNVTAVQNAIASGSLYITYSYTPTPTTNPSSVTPEPSSFALLGTGMLGIAGVVRKRFAR